MAIHLSVDDDPVSGKKWPAWGKLRPSMGGLPVTHSLIDHQIDVACVLGALCELAAVRRALETTAGRPLRAADLERLQAIAFLHDIGKANAGFQVRYWHASTERPGYWGCPAPARIGPAQPRPDAKRVALTVNSA